MPEEQVYTAHKSLILQPQLPNSASYSACIAYGTPGGCGAESKERQCATCEPVLRASIAWAARSTCIMSSCLAMAYRDAWPGHARRLCVCARVYVTRSHQSDDKHRIPMPDINVTPRSCSWGAYLQEHSAAARCMQATAKARGFERCQDQAITLVQGKAMSALNIILCRLNT